MNDTPDTKEKQVKVTPEDINYVLWQISKFDASRQQIEERIKHLESGFIKLRESFGVIEPLLSRRIKQYEANISNFRINLVTMEKEFKTLIQPFVQYNNELQRAMDKLNEMQVN